MTHASGFAGLDRPLLTQDMRRATSNLTSPHHCDVGNDRTAALRRSGVLALHTVLRARGDAGRG